jgi:hypothetical protein
MSQDMRRFVPLLIAGTVLIAAACSDSSVAPTRSTSVSLFNGPAAPASLLSTEVLAKTYTFTISPSGGSVKIGGFRLDYPANAVCDPATSGYGPEYWLADCSTLSQSITMTAKVWYSDGQAMADFSPNIRFRPDAQVMLSTKRPKLVGQAMTDDLKRAYSMLYFKMVDGARYTVDEAATDGELATKYDNGNGWVWRRIRHFSGYYVRSGEACDESGGDPTCVGGAVGMMY